MTEDAQQQVFHYRPAWQKWVLALIIMIGFTWYRLSLGWGRWAVEEPHGPVDAFYIAMIVLMVGGLGALPAVTLILLADRGHVTVTDEGVSWRTWWREEALSWSQIEAVGAPREERSWRWWRHFWFDRHRSMRLVTEDGWREILCALLPEDGDEVYEAIAREGGLTESFEHGGRSYRRRPGWTPDDLPPRHPWRRVPN